MAAKLEPATKASLAGGASPLGPSIYPMGVEVRPKQVGGSDVTGVVEPPHRRRLAVGAVAVVVVLLVAAALLVVRRSSASTELRVDGRAVVVPGTRPTVTAALRVAGIKPANIHAVVSHRVVGQVPPRVAVNGRPAAPSTRLAGGDRVVVAPVADVTEAVVSRPPPAAASGLPDVERQLWHPPGSPTLLVGELSGETIAPNPTTAPVPAAPESAKVVSLSFDDGPDPRWTPLVLAVLADERVPATFCLVGASAARHPELAAAEVAQGNTVCDHTAHHDEHLDRAPHARVVSEIDQGDDLVQAAAGVTPQFYRPPGGTLSPDVIAVAHQRGLRVLYWSVDPSDYRRPAAPVLLGRIMAKIGPGAIVLLHDGGGDRSQTVAVLRPLIDALKADGYRFTTPALERPVSPSPG